MPRYFFDIHENGIIYRDGEGHELAELAAVRKEAIRALPEIARDRIPKHGDRQAYVVLVTDQDGHYVYSAALSYVGQWLIR